MLLPIRLPMAMSRSFFGVSMMVVASLGAEVPMATMVRPTTASDTPSDRVMSTALAGAVLARELLLDGQAFALANVNHGDGVRHRCTHRWCRYTVRPRQVLLNHSTQ